MNARDSRKEQVRTANSLVEVVTAGGVELRREGRELVGLCPFHPDRRPSFSVNEEKGLWHCHGCSTGGDVFDFVAQSQGVDFKQALELLAARASVVRGDPVPPFVRRPSPPSTPVRPPHDEVCELWARCQPAHEDAGVSAWLASRNLDPYQVADRDLARALPQDGALPLWARKAGVNWARARYACVLPLFDHHGEMVSLHARSVLPNADPKSLFPAGCQIGGLVMADDAGFLMLNAGELPGELWVLEGIPDFLTAGTWWGDAADPAPASLGIVSGSWTPEIAARVPEGARVVIATDPDEAGEHYADVIVQSLMGRATLSRWKPQEGAS